MSGTHRMFLFRADYGLEFKQEVESWQHAERIKIDPGDARLVMVVENGMPPRWFAHQTDVERLDDGRNGLRTRHVWNEVSMPGYDEVNGGARVRVTDWVERLEYRVPVPPGMVESVIVNMSGTLEARLTPKEELRKMSVTGMFGAAFSDSDLFD